jgi:hypothetical protein
VNAVPSRFLGKGKERIECLRAQDARMVHLRPVARSKTVHLIVQQFDAVSGASIVRMYVDRRANQP